MAKPADSGAEESKMDGWGDEGNKAVELTRIDSVSMISQKAYSKSYKGQWWFEEDVRSLIINGHTDEVYEEFGSLIAPTDSKVLREPDQFPSPKCLIDRTTASTRCKLNFPDMLVNCISNDKLPDQVLSGYCLLP